MRLFDKVNIEILAREKSLELINEYGIEGLAVFSKAVANVVSDGMTALNKQLDGTKANITNTPNLSDEQP